MENLMIKALCTILLLTGVYLVMYYLIAQEWFINLLKKIGKFCLAVVYAIRRNYRVIMRKYILKDGSMLRKKYSKFLMFIDISVERFMDIKMILALITIIIAVLIKQTDIQLYTQEMYEKFNYKKDAIYEYAMEIQTDEEGYLLEKKQEYFREALSKVNKLYFKSNDKDVVQAYVEIIIKDMGNDTIIPTELYANEIYYKLDKYYSVRELNAGAYLLIALLVSFIPDFIMLIYNFFVKVDSKKELAFMKRLIIMNGSIKPVDFIEVLKSLIGKSKYYKKILEEIQDKNKKNYLPNTSIYLPYIRASKDLSEKLFFEKLDEANNYDFDQAIMNIKNEFNLDRRMQTRKIKKTVEAIHIFGIIGFMGLIVIVVMYLILPWMTAYKMDSMM